MKRGFTLIELLVVIAIIGILASIVLVTFPSAQRKARDARVIAAMSQMRTYMTLLYDDTAPSSYATLACSSPSVPVGLEPLCNDVETNSRGAVAATVIGDVVSACIHAPINDVAGADGFYCVDATGQARETLTNPATVGCNITPFVCP